MVKRANSPRRKFGAMLPLASRRDVLKVALAAPFGAALVGAGLGPLRNPYLQNVTSDAASVLWTTPLPRGGSVAFSSDLSFSRSVPATLQQYTSDTGSTIYQYQA